ncbi:MAG TPA: TIGR03862 family flavoprotein [Burkholderiales bacterium]|nr:TIGR03862 family flavoprotein [Burkholderiales bacterium]
MSANASRMARVAVIGGGPAGLMAAEVLSTARVHVDLYDAMPSVGRKFLLAGKGGLNLTHSEPRAAFLSRYGERRSLLATALETFDADALRTWARGLGVETFIGSSGRVFPKEMKAAPLLRAWLHRLRESGVHIQVRHRWRGWSDDGALRFDTPQGERTLACEAVVLALGGASWPQLGSDGAWVPLLAARGVDVRALKPANCGFDVAWSEHFRTRHAGDPVKSVVASVAASDGKVHRRQGEFVVSETGVEGSSIYALSAPLRDTIAAAGSATLMLDLAPGWTVERLRDELARPRGSRSLASHIQSRTGLKGVKVALLREIVPRDDFPDPRKLAAAIKSLPVRLVAARPVAEAISTAGGVAFDALEENFMLRALPGVFCAGEMLDWEAPTGGYLLTACFATGRAAAYGAVRYLNEA